MKSNQTNQAWNFGKVDYTESSEKIMLHPGHFIHLDPPLARGGNDREGIVGLLRSSYTQWMTSGAYVQCAFYVVRKNTRVARSERKILESDITMMRNNIVGVLCCVLLLFAATGEIFHLSISRINGIIDISE